MDCRSRYRLQGGGGTGGRTCSSRARTEGSSAPASSATSWTAAASDCATAGLPEHTASSSAPRITATRASARWVILYRPALSMKRLLTVLSAEVDAFLHGRSCTGLCQGHGVSQWSFSILDATAIGDYRIAGCSISIFGSHVHLWRTEEPPSLSGCRSLSMPAGPYVWWAMFARLGEDLGTTCRKKRTFLPFRPPVQWQFLCVSAICLTCRWLRASTYPEKYDHAQESPVRSVDTLCMLDVRKCPLLEDTV